jgi:hypothetical protein
MSSPDEVAGAAPDGGSTAASGVDHPELLGLIPQTRAEGAREVWQEVSIRQKSSLADVGVLGFWVLGLLALGGLATGAARQGPLFSGSFR